MDSQLVKLYAAVGGVTRAHEDELQKKLRARDVAHAQETANFAQDIANLNVRLTASQSLNTTRENERDTARAERDSALVARDGMRDERDAARRLCAEATAKTSALESLVARLRAGEGGGVVTPVAAKRPPPEGGAAAPAAKRLRQLSMRHMAKDGGLVRSVWPARFDLSWRLALEFVSPVDAGRCAAVCRAAARGAADDLLWSVYCARSRVPFGAGPLVVRGEDDIVTACRDVAVGDLASRRHGERKRRALLRRVRSLEQELSHDEFGEADESWDDERKMMFCELYYLLGWVEALDRARGVTASLDWGTPISPPPGASLETLLRDMRAPFGAPPSWSFLSPDLQARKLVKIPERPMDQHDFAMGLHKDPKFYDDLVRAEPVVFGPGDTVRTLDGERGPRTEKPVPVTWRDATVVRALPDGKYELSINDIGRSARDAYRSYASGRIAVVEVYRGGYDIDDDLCWNPMATYAYKNIRQAYSAVLEIVENDELRARHDDTEHDDWERLEPPVEWPPSAKDRASWPSWFQFGDFMMEDAFDSGTPVFVNRDYNGGPMVAISLSVRCLGAQMLDPTVNETQNVPFRFGTFSSSPKPYGHAASLLSVSLEPRPYGNGASFASRVRHHHF